MNIKLDKTGLEFEVEDWDWIFFIIVILLIFG